jgi:adenylate cyclase
LRPDPDIDFLSFSLADAVAQSLTSISSIGVRSVLAAAPFSVPAPDLTALAQKLDVSLALFGTILKAGGRCRVSAQLLEVPSGQLLCAHTSEASADDVFSLQDALTHQIVQELHLPLDKGASRVDVPASADAYELFLRGNQAALWGRDLSVARGLYRACLELDPAFSPAWARLARCYHLESKYGSVVNRAENERLAGEALERALILNPQLALAHRQQALLDVERGRAEEAVERLLDMVSKRPADPEGWAGLVTALRFLGLLTESIAAHKRARTLDPHVPTSAFHSYYSIGDFDSMLAATTNSPYEVALGLKLSGRMAEALAEIRKEVLPAQGLAREWSRALHADLVDDSDSMLDAVRRLQAFPDPEGRYYMSVLSSRFDKDLSVELLASAVDGGYVNVPAFHRDPALFRLRELPAFERALATAEKRHQAARARFANCVM